MPDYDDIETAQRQERSNLVHNLLGKFSVDVSIDSDTFIELADRFYDYIWNGKSR